MVTDIIRYVGRWGVMYPKYKYRVEKINSDKKVNNDKKERNDEIDKRIYIG